jgi:hypothetical protein
MRIGGFSHLLEFVAFSTSHHAEGLILDNPEHVDSENIKLKIGYRPLLYQLFSKRDKNS